MSNMLKLSCVPGVQHLNTSPYRTGDHGAIDRIELRYSKDRVNESPEVPGTRRRSLSATPVLCFARTGAEAAVENAVSWFARRPRKWAQH
jgi:hypothetical protein